MYVCCVFVGVLSALVTLHLALEDRPAAAAALKAATEWNLKNKVSKYSYIGADRGVRGEGGGPQTLKITIKL